MRWEQVDLCRHLELGWLRLRPRLPQLRSARGGTVDSTDLLLSYFTSLIPWLFPKLYLLKKPRFTFVYLLSLFIAIHKATAILTISEASKRDIVKLAKNKPVYVNLTRLQDAPLTPTPVPSDAPYFVYVGGMRPAEEQRVVSGGVCPVPGGRRQGESCADRSRRRALVALD